MNKLWINLMMGVGLAGGEALAAGAANAEDRQRLTMLTIVPPLSELMPPGMARWPLR